ncbi:nucleotide exchange factor GrpE [Herbidospora sp. RD11066]
MSDDVYSGHHWRTLYEALCSGEETDMLWRWLEEHPAHVAEVREAGREQRLVDLPDRYSTLERLYAVSRILDFLIELRPGVYPAFCEALGAHRIDREGFHPFFHEIVEVRQTADPDEPPAIVEERWPGFLMGDLLLARAGVVVTAGEKHLVAGVADRSALYWTFRRGSRPVQDLSHGWGHNSQWRTDMRRDYVTDGLLRYNVDGDEKPEADWMIEIVRHRCSTVVDYGDDLFPYDCHHVEPL